MYKNINKNKAEDIKEKICKIVKEKNFLTNPLELNLYSYDASSSRSLPSAVIHIEEVEQISPIVKLLYENNISFTPRCAGSNLCGAAINLKGGIILNIAKLDKIKEIDTKNNIAVVEPGVINLDLQKELYKFGYFYGPDPASQNVCCIGGNIAQNAGGPQCLKYGVTSNNIIKLETVLPNGEEKVFSIYDDGYEIISLICQSEGTLGIIKRAWLKILPLPKYSLTLSAFFNSIEDSIIAVTEIIKNGIIPKAIEEVDRLSIEAAKSSIDFPLPDKALSMLIIELDSNDELLLKKDLQDTKDILENNNAFDIKIAKDSDEREILWKVRKESYPALAKLAPNVLVEDGCVPRPILPIALKGTTEIIEKYQLQAGIIFHAGDGNLHPNIIYDHRDLDQVRRVKKAGEEILKLCIKLGGTISGEHGIGIEKRKAMSWLYNKETIDLFKRVKNNLDEKNLLNPDKKFPIYPEQIDKLNRPEINISKNAKDIINEIKFSYQNKEKINISSKFKKYKNKVINTENLTEILDFDKENMTITCEAGIKTSSLKNFLNANDLDIELPLKDNDSIGDIISKKKYLNLRDLIIGMDLVLSNGDFIRLGGKTIKNVSGYDLIKLMLGSFGTLALILNVTFKIKKRNISLNIEPQKNNAKFKFEEIHKKIKMAFDPDNIFNSDLIKDL